MSQTLSAQINADQVMRIGQNALYFEDYMVAIQYFNQAIAAKPYLAQPYFFRSIAKINLEDYLGAEADASLALERNPFITDAWEVRGVARQNLGNFQGAIDDYNEALKLLPGNRSMLFNKALAQEEVKDYEGAHVTFDQLIKEYPQFDGTYMGRARLYLLTGDTIDAKTDLDKAIELNPNEVNAYLMRADIAMKAPKPDYDGALRDMDMIIKFRPRVVGYFINRAYLRYMTDDYFGAMADYDYAIGLDPANTTAYFNRGLLRIEVRDNDRAIQDFSKVLQLDPGNTMARYNRAMLYAEANKWDRCLADLDEVIKKHPDLGGLYYMKFQINYQRGRMAEAERDYNKAHEITRKEVAARRRKGESVNTNPFAKDITDMELKEYSEKSVEEKFKSLQTVETEADLSGEYNNKSIRGKVQDRNVTVETEPIFVLSYYDSPTQLKESGYYMKDVDDINSTQILRFTLQVTNRVPKMDDEETVKKHFNSIEYYNSYLSSHEPRAIDYFGRAMDFMTTHNYQAAIADFSRAIELTPDWSLPYMMRATARYYEMKSPDDARSTADGQDAGFQLQRSKLKDILDDIDKTAELAPTSPFPYFNKGTILLENGDLTSTISALNKAIELKPDFGEAYFNRGFAYMQLGNRELGTADLSKAGELGILPSYNLLKRMNL